MIDRDELITDDPFEWRRGPPTRCPDDGVSIPGTNEYHPYCGNCGRSHDLYDGTCDAAHQRFDCWRDDKDPKDCVYDPEET